MIKFIIITLVVLYALSFVLRILFRALFFFAGKEITKQMRQQQEAQDRAQATRHGDVWVQTHAPNVPKKGKDDGDYVDFEEVK